MQYFATLNFISLENPLLQHLFGAKLTGYIKCIYINHFLINKNKNSSKDLMSSNNNDYLQNCYKNLKLQNI